MDTSCKNCTFAIYEESEQVGCEFDKINKLPKNVKLLEVFDDDAEFFVLENFVCNTARGKNVWKYWDAPDKKQKALDEIRISYDVYIKCEPEKSLDQLSEQSLKPNSVTILVESKEKAEEVLNNIRGREYPFKWNVTHCLVPVDEEIKNRMGRSKASIVCVIEEGGQLPSFDKINDFLCLDNGRFGLIRDEGCKIVTAEVARYISLNKIESFADETGEKSWIMSCRQFWA